MLCSIQSFTIALKQFVWIPSNVVNYPDNDSDNSWNMSVMNNM